MDTISYQADRDEIFLKQFNAFIGAFSNGATNYTTGEDGLAALKICDELYRSANENTVQDI
ncbi:MAG: hypothetical protein Q7J78_07035 [Clostridiales bacterium]|nr:hypothetical protein [Clostridiales bacterium]